MSKNKIIKMVISAAAAAYVAVMPVQAEENGEEENIANEAENSSQDGICVNDAIQSQDEDGKQEEAGNCREDEGQDQRPGPGRVCLRNVSEDEEDQEPCPSQESSAFLAEEDMDEDEAEYLAMGQICDGQLEKPALDKTELDELIQKNGYGPHLLLIIKEEEEKKAQEAKAEPAAPEAYSEEDLYILAHAICGEGQGYPDDEQLYIGSVILNRRAHGAYPDTIKGVVFQKGQYACTRDGNYYREPTQANWRNAKWLLENGSILPANVVYQAGFRQGSGLYVQTRYHKYCYR